MAQMWAKNPAVEGLGFRAEDVREAVGDRLVELFRVHGIALADGLGPAGFEMAARLYGPLIFSASSSCTRKGD